MTFQNVPSVFFGGGGQDAQLDGHTAAVERETGQQRPLASITDN